jgi:hypothetical protein
MLLKAKAPEYNLFSILNIKHYETKVHTPFLKHLLSPDETHQQDRLFFDYFIQNFLGPRFNKETITQIKVYEEFPFSDGRIDILIRFKMNEKPFGLVIENKIYHHDEQNQLKRYYEYLTQACNLPLGQYHLVYLKPQQGAPSNYSIDPNLYKKLKLDEAISEIGYHQHISPWLQSLLEKIEPLSVREIIHQYIQTINTL